MPIYNDTKYLSLPQRVQRNQDLIEQILEDIDALAVGPQGATGPTGPTGPAGPTGPGGIDATTLDGLSFTSTLDATLSVYVIDLSSITIGDTNAHKFEFFSDSFFSNKPYLDLWVDDVLQTKKVSVIDSLVLRRTSGVNFIMFYDENGEISTFESIADTSTLKIGFATSSAIFSMSEILSGTTVGATGLTGATGATGPQGPQGIQGLPGEQNMRYLATYTHLSTFTEYAYRVGIQIVGGDYDGMFFIKETLQETDTIKFGPYATLVLIDDNGGTIQCELSNGVTSIRVYAIENLS